MSSSDDRIAYNTLAAACRRILDSGGVDATQAEAVTDNLIWNDLIGRANFGVLRLPVYLRRVADGGLKCPCHPTIDVRSPSLALLDADDGFGQYAAALAADKAVELAQTAGIGVVGVTNSNFFGSGAYYINRIARAGMVGLALSNSFPKVAAHGGTAPVFGTNPLAFGAPRRHGDNLLVDMATSALAGSTVRECIDTGSDLPAGQALNADGMPTVDPREVAAGTLLPAAGAKGYGLALMVEILAGVLTGAAVSEGVQSMYKTPEKPGRNGHLILALDIARFMPLDHFHERLDQLVAVIKASNLEDDVRLPGEVRWRHHQDNLRNGIALDARSRAALVEASRMVGISSELIAA